MHEHPTQALFHAERFEQSLLFGHSEFDVSGHEVGEAARVLDRVEHLMHDFLGRPRFSPSSAARSRGFLVQRLERRSP